MFYDLADNPIASYSGSIEAEAVQTYNLKADCRADRFLACGPVADLVVDARVSGDVDWIDLETTRIDLTPYDGQRKQFEIRVTAGSVSAITRRNIPLRIEL